MPYGRRRRRRTRRISRRSRYRRYPSRRKKMSRKRKRTSFRNAPRHIQRKATLACPIVRECLKKIADSNIVWALQSCDGTVRTTVNQFSDTGSLLHAAIQGPYANATAENMEPCGALGLMIYSNPVTNPAAGLVVTTHHPASITYAEMPFDVNVFPMLAMVNPVVTDAIFREDNCRVSTHCNVRYFDNKHSMNITWPAVDQTAVEVPDFIFRMSLMLHEVVYFVPDLSTIEDNSLVVGNTASDTVAESQVLLRVRNTWLRRMYNSHFVNHPMADADISDVTDIVTGAPTAAFDCFNEPTGAADPDTVINDDNILPRPRDRKQHLANGVTDRRTEASVKWQRKRWFRRPRDVRGSNVHEHGGAGIVLQLRHSYIRCGRRFHMNKKFEWERTTADATPDTVVRDVVPRGCFVYVKYWYFRTGQGLTTLQNRAMAPTLTLAFTQSVDKTHILSWQNM